MKFVRGEHDDSSDTPAAEGDSNGEQSSGATIKIGVHSVIGEGPAPEGVNEAGDWYPETLILSEPLEPRSP